MVLKILQIIVIGQQSASSISSLEKFSRRMAGFGLLASMNRCDFLRVNMKKNACANRIRVDLVHK
ncbi:MAG: hypothetical protein HQM13_13900 [SAR324 cluster bacterium]|nr:hypothetical protein [SAR324 cluster bacterium]